MANLRLEVPRAFAPLWQPARYKAAWGGRGSGKSHDRAAALVVKALTQPRLRWLCAREIQKSLAQSAKLLVEDKIRAFGVQDAFRILKTHIETPGGGIIIFEGLQNHTVDSIKSLEDFDGAWVEEAQKLSQTSLTLLRPTIRKPGSEIWFTWNPHQPTDPVDAFFRGGEPPPDSVIVRANWDSNPWLTDVLRTEKEYDRRRDPDRYGHVWQGGYLARSDARVFNNWRIEEFETPPEARFYFGADWGFSVDPTVLVRCWIDGRTLHVDQEVYRVGCPIDRTPDLFGKIDGARKFRIVADSARPETIDYMQRHGFPNVTAAVKGAGSVEEGVEFLKTYDIVVHPRCRHTADELTFYSYKTDPLTDEVLPMLEDRKNHVIDALRYAVEGLRRKTSVYVGRA